MKFILDENVSKRLSKWLKDRNHDAITLHELNLLGVKNGSIADLAIKENLIIISCDNDFLKMNKIRQSQLRVIYFNLELPDYTHLKDILINSLDKFISFLKNPGIIHITDSEIKFMQS